METLVLGPKVLANGGNGRSSRNAPGSAELRLWQLPLLVFCIGLVSVGSAAAQGSLDSSSSAPISSRNQAGDLGLIVTESVTLCGGSNLLPSGDDTDPPDGNSMCHGDSLHWSHPYPSNGCASEANLHFSVTVRKGEPCSSRARRCSSCRNCCQLQADETATCSCFGNSTCESLAQATVQPCRDSCLGTFEDDCGGS
jgi:hypothetical protein